MENNCQGCVYWAKLGSGTARYCSYFLRTGIRRPCPPGEGCTVKVGRRVIWKKKKGEQREWN